MTSFERNYPRILAGFYFVVLAIFISILRLPTVFHIALWVVAAATAGAIVQLRGTDVPPCGS
jgi:hypothetical protein